MVQGDDLEARNWLNKEAMGTFAKGRRFLHCDTQTLFEPILKSASVRMQNCPGARGSGRELWLPHHWQKEKETLFSPRHVRQSTRARDTVIWTRSLCSSSRWPVSMEASVQMAQSLSEHGRNDTKLDMTWSGKCEERSDSFFKISCGCLI